MQKSLLLSLVLLITGLNFVSAQCPNTSFQVADTACVGTSVNITNTSTVGLQYQWDLSNGDLSLTPTGSNLGNIGSLVFPQQIEVVKDNGKYFAFIANYVQNTVTRLNFGSSPTNIPTAYSYGTLGGLFSAPCALDLVKDNGIWYMLVANFNANNVIKVNLGTLIENNTATGTNLGLFNINKAKNIELARDSSNFYAFVTNQTGNDLIRISFGNSMSNTPTYTSITDPAFNYNNGIDIEYDCALNKYIAVVASSGTNKINLLDFGTSLANSPVIAGSINSMPFPTGIDVIRDGNYWHILVTGNYDKFQNLRIQGNLLNTPTSIYNDTLGAMVDVNELSMMKDSSKIFGFSINSNSNTISRFLWPDNNLATPKYSTDPNGLSATFNNPGYGLVSLQVTDTISNITNYYTDSTYMSPTPVTSFITNSACDGLPVIFTDSSNIPAGSIATWSWDFGDLSLPDNNQNTSHIYATTGTYTVTLTATSDAGCSNAVSNTITVSPLPQADFGFTNNQCSNTTVSFNDLSQAFSGASIISWVWDFGDTTSLNNSQNPTHVFLNAGTYTVNLIVQASTGCIDSISQVITIIPSPDAGFTTTSTCIGETVSFSNTTTIQGGGNLNYSWNFGDSGTSNVTNPTHQYTATAGNYNVNMIALAANGCSDTILQNIRISNKPVPQFTWIPNIVCQGNLVSFTSTSTGTGGDTIAAYNWDFGDLTGSSLENPTHVYADTGYFNVTLTVVSPTFCDSSITHQVYVIPSPSASFTANNVCLNLSTGFNPLVSTPPATQVDSIVWSFGDGNGFSGLTSPVHTYLLPGRYEVVMTVYNNLLCTGTFIDSVDVYPLPVADFTTTLSCSGSITGFDGNSSSVTGDTLSGWLWNFDGLGSSTDTIAQFSFPNEGTYNVTLITTTIHGCTDTIQKPIVVIQSPDFDFTFNEPCFGNASNFGYVSNINPAPPADLIWNFGDGSLSYLLSPSHIYTAVDTFDVVLTVQNPTTFCSATKLKQLIIKPLPQAGYSVNDNCEDLPLQFTDISSVASGFIASWNWNLGTLGNFVDPDPVVIPATPGTYPTSLLVTTDQGCTGTFSKNVTVFARPNASFTPDPLYGSPPLTVTFDNTTTGGVSYSWDFGDGGTATGTTPVHIYADTGLFNITMVAASAEGCLDTANSIISVLIPNLDLGVRKVFATMDGTNIKLTAELINAGNVNIQQFTIKGIIENGSLVSEQWTGSFAPGTTMLYTFKSSYEVATSYAPAYFCIEAVNPNDSEDSNPLNNKKCEVFSSEFELFSAYPNPFDEFLNVSFNLNTEGEYSLEIYDDGGKMVADKENLHGLKGFNTAEISTITLSKGTYTCVIRFRDENRTLKVLKIK